ncbi:phosphate propanoyltransferase [bacterium]|nr:phosphate propanoyltransferase [bacterium]
MISEKDAVNSITKFIVNRKQLLDQDLIPVAVSSRHLHISRADLDILFGNGYQLKPVKLLSQPEQFAAEEKVTVAGPRGEITNVRILGPERKETQVEVSLTDGFKLGIKPPVRDSGNLDDSPGIKLIGPVGEITLEKGIIASLRHIHMTEDDSRIFGVKNKDIVGVQTSGPRGLLFENVLVRVSNKYFLEMHIDTDEANAAGLGGGASAKIVK